MCNTLCCVFRVARNPKVSINSESTRTKAKREKIAKKRIKRDENRDIKKARKERTGGEVETKKVTGKRSIVARTVERKAKKVCKMA